MVEVEMVKVKVKKPLQGQVEEGTLSFTVRNHKIQGSSSVWVQL